MFLVIATTHHQASLKHFRFISLILVALNLKSISLIDYPLDLLIIA